MATSWIVLYVNCFRGRFIPYGPFDDEEQAHKFATKNNKNLAFPLYEVVPLVVVPENEADW